MAKAKTVALSNSKDQTKTKTYLLSKNMKAVALKTGPTKSTTTANSKKTTTSSKADGAGTTPPTRTNR